jgi:hypothetical protein
MSESVYREMWRFATRTRGTERAGRPRHRWSNPRGQRMDCGSAVNQTAYWLELLVDGKIVCPDKL